MDHAAMGHGDHVMKQVSQISWWDKFKMSMTMAMGMEHTGLAGREMARLMEEDIRNKFFFALILSIPIILYSPLGEQFLKLRLPTPIPGAWILFILSTPVFFYSGWIFLYSTYKALQAKTLNMAVLVAVGITAAYAFSVLLTFLGSSDSYYEAAALLITFVLFGHWMEMKSRRGTTDALQALFNLVPPQARVIRNGKEELIPTAQVKLGDIIVLKPGDKVPVDGEITEGETAKVVLMKSDPADVLRAIKLSKATVRKMKQNLFWASIYNLLAIPVAAGVLYPSYNISLRPEVSALLMSISSIIVATNAVLLNRAEKDLISV